MYKKGIPFFILILALAAGNGGAEEVLAEQYGYYLDIPEGWKLLDARDQSVISFADPSRRAVFQIMAFPDERFPSAAGIAAHFRERFSARGDEAPFTYGETDAVIADYTFQAGRHGARGWFVFINGTRHDYALAAFAPGDLYEDFQDQMLSCLDGFSPGKEERLYPGPVSHFYNAFPPEVRKDSVLDFPKGPITFSAGDGEAEANQTVIEREARILASVREGFPEAWRRFYRIIYRDTYMRLLPLAESLSREGATPASLLAWFQGFSYTRTGSLADFQSPLTCVLSSTGDCDSLGLAYVILLHQLGYNAILMVSSEYSHAMAAVDIPGEGARFTYEGTDFLVAEMTEKVDLGRINQDMADPQKWLGVAFDSPVRP